MVWRYNLRYSPRAYPGSLRLQDLEGTPKVEDVSLSGMAVNALDPAASVDG